MKVNTKTGHFAASAAALLALALIMMDVRKARAQDPGPDFNGDGFADLAIGVPFEDIVVGPGVTVSDAGAVNVIYGSANGLSATKNQFWNQDRPGMRGTAGDGDQFGKALAWGDFDADGFDDLAIGVPMETVTTGTGLINDAGAVNILYGSDTGLTGVENQLWHQNHPDLDDGAESSDQFGSTLAVGDFNGDGFDDLAIGVPLEDVGDETEAGAVHLLYGFLTGLDPRNNELWHQAKLPVSDGAEPFDRFGSSLAAGNFDGDAFADLAVGVPFESAAGRTRIGAVNVLYGFVTGVTSTNAQVWHQESPGILDQGEASDLLGWSVAAGDFDGDGFDDLAAGVPFEDVGQKDAGAFNVLYGSAGRLAAARNQFWHQESAGIRDVAEAGDRFAWVVTAGDFDGDGRADLAAGVPFEDVGATSQAGSVAVLYGTAGGLASAQNQLLNQDTFRVKGVAEPLDRFGFALFSGNFDGGAFADLAVGVPLEDIKGEGAGGAVNVLYGSGVGVSANGNELWHQDVTGIQDAVETGDQFGEHM